METRQPQPGTVAVVNTPPRFHQQPIRMICPYCHVEIVTTAEQRVNVVSACFCGPCALCDDLMDVQHTCQNCRNRLGRYDAIAS